MHYKGITLYEIKSEDIGKTFFGLTQGRLDWGSVCPHDVGKQLIIDHKGIIQMETEQQREGRLYGNS